MLPSYKYSFLILLVNIFIGGQLMAQEEADYITLEINSMGELFFHHSLQRGETIYSLSRKYSTDVQTIVDNNELVDLSSLNVNQNLAIPVNKELIFSGNPSKIPALQHRTPIYYEVKAKETLYKVAKTYLDKPIESIMHLNNLTSFDLSVGQKLLVGWLLEPLKPALSTKPDSTSPSIEMVTEKKKESLPKDTINLFIKNKLFAKKDSLTNTHPQIIKNRKEIAIWDRNAPNTNKMYALHKEARKNSIIEIHNPLLNRTAFATVIGSVPDDSYTEDITLIISPEVAEALGALDKRFMVEVKYYQ